MQICAEPLHVSGIKEQALEIFLGPGAVDHVINLALQRFAPTALFLFWRFLHAVTMRVEKFHSSSRHDFPSFCGNRGLFS